ncbi:MAG: 2Fe-2S iron-sulfur cluster-binding protein [Microthrixaceae bacterium]
MQETDDAVSLVLSPPEDLRGDFTYDAGQYCTFRVHVGDETFHRCYSMSSVPLVGEPLTVTVKRVPDGSVSNWINDNLRAGDHIDATAPAGNFRLEPSDGPMLALAAGSGITPIISLVKSALETTAEPIHLLYANRDENSVIFARELERLEATSGGRLQVVHHLDAHSGFLDADSMAEVLGTFDRNGASGDDTGRAVDVYTHAYVCGPEPFMDIAEATLKAEGLEHPQIHLERFVADEHLGEPTRGTDQTGGSGAGVAVTIELEGTTVTAQHQPATTVLQTARQAGLVPPYSCEAGNCATCMARVVSGSVQMRVNDALTPDEVDEGWILTCQSVPTSETLHVVYGYE